jgi:hypothetical protein
VPFEAMASANQPGASAISIFPVNYELSLADRVYLMSVRHRISTLEKKVMKIKIQ